MRTVIVTTSYPAHPQDPAGHFVRSEAVALADRGEEVHVVAPSSPGAVSYDEAVRIRTISHGGAFGWPGASARMMSRPWRAVGASAFMANATAEVRRLAPDRIIAHWLVPSAFPIASSVGGDIEAVAHGADVRLLLAMPALLREHIVDRLLARVSSVRFVAHATYDALAGVLPQRQRKQLERRVSIMPAALWVPDVSAEKRTIRLRIGDAPLAVTAARLVSPKRVDLAIGAMRAFDGTLCLAIIGDGPDLERLTRLAAGNDVRFLGRLPRNLALGWIAAADVLLHTSAVEAAPTVVREARALGTPVVACGAGDLERWARADPGVSIVAPSAQDIARGIVEVLGRSPQRAVL